MKLPHDSLAGTLTAGVTLTIVLYLVTGLLINGGAG